MKEKLLAAWETVKAHWGAIVSIGFLLLLLAWRALRYNESVTEGLQDYAAGMKLQTEAIKAALKEAELTKQRKERELEALRLKVQTEAQLKAIESADAKHVADEWNRLGKTE